MDPIKIFVVSRDAQVLLQVLDFLKEKGCEADGASENEPALLAFPQKNYDIAILGGGIDNASRDLFKKEFVKTNKEIEFVEHYCHPAEFFEELKDAWNF